MLPKRVKQSVKTTEENENEMASRLHLDIGECQLDDKLRHARRLDQQSE